MKEFIVHLGRLYLRREIYYDLIQNYEWTNCGFQAKAPIDQASINYNCHAYAYGRTDVWLTSNLGFRLHDCFGYGTPDWETPGVGQTPNRAAHGPSVRTAHSSIVSKPQGVYLYKGKFGYAGVYEVTVDYLNDDCTFGGGTTLLIDN